MAFARIEIVAGWSENEKAMLIERVRVALVEALRVPADDPTVILIEHAAAAISLPRQMSSRYTVVTVTMFTGRTAETKRRLFTALTDAAVAAGASRDEVDVVLHDPPMENWARGGIPSTDSDLDFEVEI